MKPSADLFDLIKSLTPTEKRYFKINASKHTIGEKNNYVRLFDAIDKQKAYDEAAIKKYFKSEAFIIQTTSAKNYLYNLILKSLNSYHSEVSVDTRLKELFRNVEILYAKSLYKQCGKVLEKAKELAYAYEKHLEILEALKWDRTLLHFLNTDQNSIKQVRENYRRENKKALNAFESVRRFETINDTISSVVIEEGQVRNKDKMKKLNEIFQKDLAKVDVNELVFDAKKFYYNACNIYSFAVNEHEKNYAYCKSYTALMESNPKQIELQPRIYIVALNNYIKSCHYLKKDKETIENIKKMRGLALMFPKNLEVCKHVFESSYSLELGVYENGDFEKGVALVKRIEEGFNIHKVSELYKVILQLQIAYMYFGTGAYSNALKWLNKIIHNTTFDLRQDILCHSRIFNLIIHFELGNKDHLEYIVKSTYRFLYKKERLYKFETIILNFIRRSSKANTEKELTNLFKALRLELLPLEKDPYEKRMLEFFDFISWLDSKIEKRNFADCVKRRGS